MIQQHAREKESSMIQSDRVLKHADEINNIDLTFAEIENTGFTGVWPDVAYRGTSPQKIKTGHDVLILTNTNSPDIAGITIPYSYKNQPPYAHLNFLSETALNASKIEFLFVGVGSLFHEN